MNDFILDLWHDLREKRLWPVAAVLLLALVAVPVVLIKPAKEAPSQATPAAGAKPLTAMDAQKALVKLEGDRVSDDSNLGAFLKKDPFKPVGKLLRASESMTAKSEPVAGGTTGADTAGAGGSTGAGEPSSGGVAPSDGDGGGDGGSGQPQAKNQKYTYAIDLTLSTDGKPEKIKRLKRLEALPSSRNPLLVFLGVTEKGDEAVFLVDSTLNPTGEGRCKPSRKDCSFLHLNADEEEAFTDAGGTRYVLGLDEIDEVRVGKASSSRAARGRRARATGEQGRSSRDTPGLFDFLARPPR
jgi:hypothetical protein